MNIAVLADIHGNGIAFQHVLEDMKTQDINKVIILGDVVMKGPTTTRIVEELQKLDCLAWIQGNTDKWFKEISDDWKPETNKEKEIKAYCSYARENMSKESIEFINNLPFQKSLICENVSMLCVHGTPQDIQDAIDGSVPVQHIKELIKDIKEDVLLCAHSHCSYIGEVDGKKIFNPGSIGLAADGDLRASYGILKIDDGNVEIINRRVAYPIDELFQLAEESSFPNLNLYKRLIMNEA
ncbi:metallophosphoesterase family protein [Clostridium oryzae]|uniref:Phosphoesterase n=1 Tax=Clostridium oryzae TaxID=1450648 RepID=A0A1V4IV93_9CLOT|nr:metallophosphoesterase family protein [Clostridium oryzae]OPJ63951.1 phosphodiesterase [Clostridium oryzae]